MVRFANIGKPRQFTTKDEDDEGDKDINDLANLVLTRLQALGDNADTHEVVTSNPSGSLRRLQGTMVFFNDAGTFRWFVNTDGATTWQENT